MNFRLRPPIRVAIGVGAIVCSGLIWIVDWAARAEFVGSHFALLRKIATIITPLVPVILWPLLLLLGIGLIWWDMWRRSTANARAQISQQEGDAEQDSRDRIVKWLRHICTQPAHCVSQAFLFGSVVHDHFPTSDVDLIIQFKPINNRRLKNLVRTIKGRISEDFERTFRHKLHVTFFCSDEAAQLDQFLVKAGKHEAITRGY
jgi:predicted nucleotidyltransferase